MAIRNGSQPKGQILKCTQVYVSRGTHLGTRALTVTRPLWHVQFVTYLWRLAQFTRGGSRISSCSVQATTSWNFGKCLDNRLSSRQRNDCWNSIEELPQSITYVVHGTLASSCNNVARSRTTTSSRSGVAASWRQYSRQCPSNSQCDTLNENVARITLETGKAPMRPLACTVSNWTIIRPVNYITFTYMVTPTHPVPRCWELHIVLLLQSFKAHQ